MYCPLPLKGIEISFKAIKYTSGGNVCCFSRLIEKEKIELPKKPRFL